VSTIQETLLVALAAGREMEAALVDACDDAPPVRPDVWTVRDHLAHVAHYCEYAAAVLDAVRTGVPAPADAEADLDERNARICAENRGLSAAEAVERAHASYGVLVRAVERCSDDDLLKPRSPGADVPVWRLVPGCAWGHIGQHLAHWHLYRGEPEAAERAARRVHEIEMASVDDPRQRAAATYNLGCFYATAGRPDEAVPLIREALAHAPDLCEWAQQDPDLVSVRHLLPPPA
jgi:tetratricopeptide (TPR) repeat protein